MCLFKGRMHPATGDHRPPHCKIVLKHDDIGVLASREAAFAVVDTDHACWREAGHPHRLGQRDTNCIAQDWHHLAQQGRAAGERAGS